MNEEVFKKIKSKLIPVVEILVCDRLICHFIFCLPEKQCLSGWKCWKFYGSRKVNTSFANTELFELHECSPQEILEFLCLLSVV